MEAGKHGQGCDRHLLGLQERDFIYFSREY
jgi:hypothetical protein